MKECTLITGASSGIGYEFAYLFARDGHNLILVARREENLKKMKEHLEGLYNIEVFIIALDLINRESAQYIYEFVDNNNIIVNNLVNNAGVGSFGMFSEVEEKKDLEIIDLNIYALTKLTKKFLPLMIERKKGGIINVASTASFAPGVNMSVYYASKAYVLSLTEALYEECIESGVRIMALCPGAVDTEFQSVAKVNESKSSRGNIMTPEQVAREGYKFFTISKAPIVIPGNINKLLVFMARFMPRKLIRNIIKKVNT